MTGKYPNALPYKRGSSGFLDEDTEQFDNSDRLSAGEIAIPIVIVLVGIVVIVSLAALLFFVTKKTEHNYDNMDVGMKVPHG